MLPKISFPWVLFLYLKRFGVKKRFDEDLVTRCGEEDNFSTSLKCFLVIM